MQRNVELAAATATARSAISVASVALLGLLVLGACSDDKSQANAAPPGFQGGAGEGAGAAPVAGGAGATAGSAGIVSAGSGAAGNAGSDAPAAGAGGAAGAEAPMAGEPAAGDGSGAGAGGMDSADPPAAGDEAPDETMDNPEPMASRPPSTRLMLETTTENPMVEPYFQIYRPTDMEAAIEKTGGPLPVVVWASGGCFRADFAWAALLERWAAGGYVVLGLTPGPDASVPGTTTSVEHGQLVDWVVEQTDFPDMLDLDRIVASGNSCGGVTALQLTSMDDRVAAVFILSGSSAIGAADTTVMAGVQVPLGFVVGSPGVDIAAGPAQMDYDLLGDGLPGMLVNHASGDHILVSTDATVLPEVAEIALNWMDLALYGTPEAAEALESDEVCDACSADTWTLTKKNWDALLP